MIKCPNCGKEQTKPKKSWKYDIFTVQDHLCNNCGTHFRDYLKDGKHSFTLKHKKGKGTHARKGWTKA